MTTAETDTSTQPKASAIEIILTDDDPDDLYLAREAAMIAGIATQFRSFNSGLALFEYIQASIEAKEAGPPKNPMIIMLDINMPLMDGFSLLKTLKQKEETRHIPIIIYSTSESAEDIQKAYTLGANSYLVKPVEFEALVDLMWGLHAYWLDLVRIQ